MAKVHIKLTTIKAQLQLKMHYPLTREEAGDDCLTLDEAFDALLYGFDNWLQRHDLGSRNVVHDARRRYYFTEKYADLFTDYCITGWRIV